MTTSASSPTQEQLLDLLADAPLGAFALTPDQTIVFWNRAAQRILGFSATQAVGRHCYEVAAGPAASGISAECSEGGCPALQAFRAGEPPHAMTLELVCASGERKEISITPIVVAGTAERPAMLVQLFADGPVVSSPAGRIGVPIGLAQARAAEIAATGRDDAGPPLTGRELQVLRLVALGWRTQRIAEELDISVHTVRNHVRNFRRKLRARTKLDAVLNAMRLGYLEDA